MFTRPHTMMAISLAAAVLVLSQELSAAQQQSAIGSLSCKYQNGEVSILEDQPVLRATTGCNCGSSIGNESITLQGSSPRPAFANRATVFLSGWYFDFGGDQHRVAQIETHIDNISLVDQLTWTATGILRDQNFDDPLRWCYYYTVLAWDDTKIAIQVNHDNTSNHSDSQVSGSSKPTATVVLDSYSLAANDPRHAAVLPRGFGFSWGTEDPNANPAAHLDDHNLLQLAYNLTHRALFVRPKGYGALPDPPLSEPVEDQVDAGLISWQSHGILKDNDQARDWRFMEAFSVLSGAKVYDVEPPFTILPAEDVVVLEGGICIGGPNVGETSRRFEIAKVPFLAIPMLTGWDLNYGCMGDHFVQQIGVWLSDMAYVPPITIGQPGKLDYTVTPILRDDDPNQSHFFQYKVDVLGLK